MIEKNVLVNGMSLFVHMLNINKDFYQSQFWNYLLKKKWDLSLKSKKVVHFNSVLENEQYENKSALDILNRKPINLYSLNFILS